MRTPSRLLISAAIAAAALVPLASAAPAIAAPVDGIPTTARLTITTDASTVPMGDGAVFHVLLVEGANGDPAGLSGRLVVDRTVDGVSTSRVDAVHAPNTVQTLSLDTSRAGAVLIKATFVPNTQNQPYETATATITVLAPAKVSVLNDTVDAGAAIVARVGELHGSDGADGRIEATATGVTLSACGPAPTDPEQSACSIPVPKGTPSGTYLVTFAYSGSPRYADATATIAVTIIGTPKTSGMTTAGSGTTTTSTSSSTRTGSAGGTRTTAASGSGTSALSGTTIAGTSDGVATPSPSTTDAPAAQPTEVAAPLPAAAGSGIPAAAARATGLPIPLILAAVAAAGVIGLLLVVLLIVLIVRSRRTAA